MKRLFQIHPADTVAVALEGISAGEEGILSNGERFTVQEDIPAGHKAALRDIALGEEIRKYGQVIGAACRSIGKGEWVHTHNLASVMQSDGEYTYTPGPCLLPPQAPAFFQGYRRPNGKVGVRNEIWILPTVGCVNGVVSAIEAESRRALAGAESSVDGVFGFHHPLGCSQLGEDHQMTQHLLAGLIRHPNAGGVLVVGLGCENNAIAEMQKVLDHWEPERVRFLECQSCDDEIETGVRLVKELWEYASGFHRELCPAAELMVGLKCGGSDGYSGITANPLVGAFSDQLLALGGTALLTEVPEMFGAEQLLMDRCRTREAFKETVSLIRNFKGYFLRYGQPVDENPSPGNRAGGITTLAEKSLGCIQKAGSGPVEGVLSYGESPRRKGLFLLQGPGNDLVAACALAASGAHLILFTTGRGTPLGSPVPTMKIASNSALAAKKPRWIDFNAGRLLEGERMDSLSKELFMQVLEIASGQRVQAESLNRQELAIFRDGVTL